VFADGGISSVGGSKCAIEMHLLGMHGGVTDTRSSVENCLTVQNTVGSLSDGMAGIPQESMMYNESNDELMRRAPAVVTVANQMTGSMASSLQMPNMTGQLIPVDNACHCGSMVQIRVFSTKLANCAAESVRIGRCESIVDFHRDYCAFPMSQVYTPTGC